MSMRWHLPLDFIPQSEKSPLPVRDILEQIGVAILGETTEAVYKCACCNTVYGARSVGRPQCPMARQKSCHAGVSQQQKLLPSRPVYILDVPDHRLDLLDLGGVATKFSEWINDSEDAPFPRSQVEVKIGELPDPSLKYVLALSLERWPAVKGTHRKSPLTLEWYLSLGEMLRYLNNDFGRTIGQHCLVQCFQMQDATPACVEISCRDAAPQPSHWGNLLVDATMDGKVLPVVEQTSTRALFLIAGSDRRMTIALADALIRTVTWRGGQVSIVESYPHSQPSVEPIILRGEDIRQTINLEIHFAKRWIGLRHLNTYLCVQLLKQLGYSAGASLDTLLDINVKVPLYRFDVLSQVDLIADLAIPLTHRENSLPARHRSDQKRAFGAVYGKENVFESSCDVVRQTMVGLRFREIISPDIISEIHPDDPLVEDHPNARQRLLTILKTGSKHLLLRKHLFSGLMDHLRTHLKWRQTTREGPANRTDVHVLPHRANLTNAEAGTDQYAVFEIADGFEKSSLPMNEVGINSIRWLAGLISQPIVESKRLSRWSTLFAETKAVVEAVLRENFNPDALVFAAEQSPLFFRGRSCSIRLQSDGSLIGRFGEVKADVLGEHTIDWPVALFELDLTRLDALAGRTD